MSNVINVNIDKNEESNSDMYDQTWILNTNNLQWLPTVNSI